MASLDMLAEATGWAERERANERERAAGHLRGIGVALAVEHSAYGKESLGSRQMEITPGYDTAGIRVEPDGRVRLAVGLHSRGQGQKTTMAQIAADRQPRGEGSQLRSSGPCRRAPRRTRERRRFPPRSWRFWLALMHL